MLRQDLRSWTRTNWWLIAQVLAYGLGIAALCLGFAVWWPRSNDFVQGLIAGIGLAVLVAILGLAFLINTGNVPRLVGAWAEDDTDAALKAAVKAHQIHGYVSHIVLDGYDIDAVAITSSGVVAIETKWHGKPPARSRSAGTSHPPDEPKRRHDRSCDRCTARARPSRVWWPCGDRSANISARVSRATIWTCAGRPPAVLAGAARLPGRDRPYRGGAAA